MAQDDEGTAQSETVGDTARRSGSLAWLPPMGLIIGGAIGALLTPVVSATPEEAMRLLKIAPALGAAIGLFMGGGILVLVSDHSSQRSIKDS